MPNVNLFIGETYEGEIEYFVSGLDIAVLKPKSVTPCALPIERYLEAVEACVKLRDSAYRVMADVVFTNAYNGFGDTTGDDDYGMSCAWIDLHDFITEDGHTDVPHTCKGDSDALTDWIQLHPHIRGRRWALVWVDSNGNKSFDAYQTRSAMMRDYRAFEKAYLDWSESVEEVES